LRNEDEIFIAGSVIGSIFINNEVVIQNLDTYASFFIKFNSDLAIENTFVSEPSLGVVDIIFGNNNIYIYDYQFYYVDSVANPVFYYPKLKKLDFEYNTLWTKIINEKSFPNNGGTGFINDIPLKSIIDNNGNLISMFSSLSYKFLFGGDSSGYSTNFSSLFSYNYENYLIQIDSNGNDLGFYDFKSDLGSSGITITSMYNGNIVTAGEYRDSIFNIGPYELLNPEPLNREIIVHGSFIYSRKAYTYLASLKFSPTTGLISNQTSSLPSKLYPNPSNNFIKIKFEQPLKANSELIVFSIDGKLMTKQNFPSGTSEIHLDVSSFPKGMYLAGVQSGDERVIHKFLKE
jgi:hypothetical protein